MENAIEEAMNVRFLMPENVLEMFHFTATNRKLLSRSEVIQLSHLWDLNDRYGSLRLDQWEDLYRFYKKCNGRGLGYHLWSTSSGI